MKQIDHIEIIVLREDKYIIYHRLLGNVRIIDKKMLALILKPELANKVDNHNVRQYVNLFKKEGYIKELNEEKESSIPTDNSQRDIVIIDLNEEKLTSNQEFVFLNKIKKLINEMNKDKIYVNILNKSTEVNYQLIGKILSSLRELTSIEIQVCMRLSLKTISNHWYKILLPIGSIFEVVIDDKSFDLHVLSELFNFIENSPTIIHLKTSKINTLHIEEIFKVIRGMKLLFNLDLDEEKITDVDKSINEIMNIQSLAKEYDVLLYGWWSKPFEKLIKSKPDYFCNAYYKQVVISPNKGTSYCLNSKWNLDTEGHSYDNSLDDNSPFDQEVVKRRQLCEGCSIEGFCGLGCIYWQKVKMNSICNFLTEITLKLLEEKYSFTN